MSSIKLEYYGDSQSNSRGRGRGGTSRRAGREGGGYPGPSRGDRGGGSNPGSTRGDWGRGGNSGQSRRGDRFESGRGRGRGTGRLIPNRPSRNDNERWRDGRGRGGSRGGQSTGGRGRPAFQHRPKSGETEETKIIEVQAEDLIHHTFFPKRLPENAQEHLVDVEEKLLEQFISGISNSITDVDGFQELEASKSMIEKWKEAQPKWRSDADEEHCADFLKEAFQNQKEGETLALYIRKQNCTVMITKLDEKFTQLCTFRAMPRSETVMSSVGSPTMSFPQTCDVFYNKKLLTSDMFLYHLHQLSVEDFEAWSLPSIKKGESRYPDYRDVAEPCLVSDWCAAVLCPANYTPNEDKLPFGRVRINKKIRDQVNCQMSSRAIPFRRSGMYLSTKVALQLKLIEDIGNSNDALVVYKLIMLRILTDICQKFVKEMKECAKLDLDLGSQLVAKLGRRVSKLEKMTFSQENDNEEQKGKLLLLRQKCLEYCHAVVSGLQGHMTGLWRLDASSHSVVKPIIRSNEDFQKDLLQEIMWLDTAIMQSKPIPLDIKARSKKTAIANLQKVDALKKSADFQRSLLAKRYASLELLLKNQHAFNSQYSDIGDINERIWVYDTEYYLKHKLDLEDLGEEDEEKVQNLIVAYFKNAVPRFTSKNDPVALSQMILVILKALQIMDKICTKKHPLLLRYQSGVKTDLFDKLLLPHQEDILMLNELLDYFKSRNDQATFPSLIEDNRLQPLSFPVCFAQENQVMRAIRQRILKDTAIAEKAKLAEVKKVKAECEELDRALRSCGGLCKAQDKEDGEIHDNQRGKRSFDAITCKRCKINSLLRFKKRSVKIFERPLPVDPDLQWGVIFELKTPPEISLLRDMLALLNFEIIGDAIFGGSQIRRCESIKPPPVEDWRGYMKRQGPTEDYKSQGGSALNCLDLVSPRLPFSGTCNAKIENPDVLIASVHNFIVDNDLDCVYYHEKPLWFPIIKNSPEICTFQLSSTCQPDAQMYGNLQWAMGSTTHCDSQAIAGSQDLSHRQLTPEEYSEFGSIRADGDTIQLRNLYRAIHDRTLSLQREPVLALVLQVLWQVGPRKEEDGVRQFHEDFTNSEFSKAFLEKLDELVESCEGNYSEPLVLLIAIVITVKILEANPEECKDQCCKLLTKSRKVVQGWVEKIEENLVSSADIEDDTTEVVNFLKARLLEATLCSMFSYNVANEKLVKIVIQTEEDHVHWFHSISRLHQLTEEEQCHKSVSPFVLILLSNVRNIPLKLGLEKCLSSNNSEASAPYAAAKTIMLQSLHQFTCDRWSKVTDCLANTSLWNLYDKEKSPHMLTGAYEEAESSSRVKAQHFLSLDLLQGVFLVNGFPQTTLPAAILHHPLFQRYFKDSKFRIQRYSTSARTIDKFHGRHYDFEMIVSRSKEKLEVESLFIREIQEDKFGRKRVLEMVEPVLFRHAVGATFSDNYTHWLDTEKKEVYFRRLPKQDSDYKLPHDYKLVRDDHGNWKFYDERLRKYLLCIHSEGFKLVTAALSRLESKEEINVLLDIASGLVTAKLPRFNLSFNLVNTALHSVEYTGFRISENQNYGTLIGLQHGVLMELGEKPDKYSKRILIVPHGYLESCLLNLKHHHNTVVDLDHLRSPRFFAYDYDTVLRQLKADKSQSAWLYLAALHAYTSSSLPDPFTQVTGIERAVDILQSGHAWPSQPYDRESLETLGLIRDLAPRRSYYAHGINFLNDHDSNKEKKNKGPKEKMEITQWRDDITPSMVAYDGYPFIVDKLIENSARLVELHEGSIPPQKIQRKYRMDDTAEESGKLQLRSYLRHLSLYNQAAIVPPAFFKKSSGDLLGTGDNLSYSLRSKSSSSIAEGYCLRELQIISQTRLVNTFEKRSMEQWRHRKCDLESHLISEEPIAPLIRSSASTTSLEGLRLKDLLNLDFEMNWLQLYTWAINKTMGQSDAFTLVLNGLAYSAMAPLDQIMHLHHISHFSGLEEFPEVPHILCAFPRDRKKLTRDEEPSQTEDLFYDDLIVPTECNYEPEEIQAILESHLIPPNAGGEEESGPGLESYLDMVRADAIRISAKLAEHWPCEKIPAYDKAVKELFNDSNIRFSDAMNGVNGKIGYWHRNQEFNKFVNKVQDKLSALLKAKVDQGEVQECQELYKQFDFSLFTEIDLRVGILIDGVHSLNLPEMMVNLPQLEEARAIFESGHWMTTEEIAGKDYKEQRQLYADKIVKLMEDISKNIVGGDDDLEKKIMDQSGIAPRIVPTALLRYLQDSKLQREESPLWVYCGALGTLWSHLKRVNRCIEFQRKGESAISDLRKEEENRGHDENWKPIENPEWLLLELELDIMIRPKQVRVARQMIKMPGGRNGTMQLNMGEGKTSAIVPMLCATLADNDTLCRVTVLSSMFKTNLNILRFAIGGLLNRRVYTFPCKRTVQINVKGAEKLLECLKECLNVQGVILTVPEHRLSFRLLALDKINKREFQLGAQLLHIENWLRYYCRDILDESDELLKVNYQLVYTTGTRMLIDGESLRWTTCQKILNSVRNVAEQLKNQGNAGEVEFDEDKQNRHPEQFTPFRLLSDYCLGEFRELVAEDLLELPDFKLEGVQRMIAKLFLTEELISEENHNLLITGLQQKPELLNKILLASAYLRRDVLTVALKKRWRVEYGVNPVGERLMAVPFRAKDVATERTEFGHPDLAILLTHLSYYYSGLSDNQLRDCFEMLKRKKGGEEIYDDWIGKMLPESVPPNLRLFQRLNLNNTEQTAKLFPLLKRHKCVVDYWLSHKVFPRESNQFTKKMAMTGWDLCHERHRLPITGFSGTNDSQDLLPLTTAQHDLEELTATNLEMENVLLQPQNNENHKGFQMGVTCADILTELTQDSIRTLIDAGAITDCTNEELADLWLQTDPDIEAAIYYGVDGEAMVKCRRDADGDEQRKINDVRLEESPFKYNLGRCAVFLDDHHTRGVDFKFPDGSQACVTVGSKMMREKLVQACMRMRKLDSGEHSVTFYLSHEAHTKVNGGAREINTEDILKWVKQNTTDFIRNGVPLLCLNGINYMQKLVAEDNLNFPAHAIPLYSPSSKSHGVLEVFAKQCENAEVTSLLEMYGLYAKKERLVDIVPIWFEMTTTKLMSMNLGASPIPGAILSQLPKMEGDLIKKCGEICDEEEEEKTVFSSCGANVMEEEQEKELEKWEEKEAEVEEEREVQKPSPPRHFVPEDVHPNVTLVVLKGEELKKKPGIVLISEVFKDTTFWGGVQPENWGERVFATEDFARVIQRDQNHLSTDLYLRPIHWVASQNVRGGDEEDDQVKLLVLSPFEVNKLKPKWKGDQAIQLRQYCRRKFQSQSLLVNQPGLQLPIEKKVKIPEDCRALAPLSVASGNLYFGNDEERASYRSFVENFEGDPTQVVKKILTCRHPVLSEVSHVIRLLEEF